MEIKLINSDFDQNLYNRKAIHPLQSWQWGEAREKMGIKIIRIGEFSNDQLINVFQISLHHIPYTSYKIGYLPRSIFPSKETLNFIFNYATNNQIILIKLEPYIKKSSGDRISEFMSISDFHLIKSTQTLFPEWTQILDLTKNQDELLKNMKTKTRYNIKLAEKKGVKIKEMTNQEGFDIFIKLYFDTCKRQKYFGHNRNYHQIIFDSLKNNITHILIAFFKDTPLAAYELFNFNKVFYYTYGGTSLEFRNLMASNLLMWEAIKLGKILGTEKFDMWGSLSPNYNQNHPWAGFTRFKEGYGTEFVQMIGSYDLIVNPIIYKLYNLGYILRNFYLNLKR